MSYKLCTECGQPMLPKGKYREHPEDYRHASGCPKDDVHLCHARGCTKEVPPKLLMCARHWRMVPSGLKRAVWFNYRIGQEIDKKPSEQYLEVMRKAIDAVAQLEERRRQPENLQGACPSCDYRQQELAPGKFGRGSMR